MPLSPMVRTLVSLWVPEYARVDDLAETIASVQAQTDPDWRLAVAVADPAGPLAEAILTRHADDDRVTLTDGPIDHPGAAHNQAIARTPSQYVVALHHDDLLAPAYLETVTRCDGDLVHTALAIPAEAHVPAQTLTPPSLTVDELTANPPATTTICQRRTLWQSLDGYDPGLPGDASEWDYCLRAAQPTTPTYLPEPLTVSRNTPHQPHRVEENTVRAHIVARHPHHYNTATRQWAQDILRPSADKQHTPHEILVRRTQLEEYLNAVTELEELALSQQLQIERLEAKLRRV